MPQILDWLVQSYISNSPPLNASRAVNMFAELEVQDAKSEAPVAVWGAAGTSPFADTGRGPVKAFDVMNDIVYAISGNALFQIDANGTVHNLGTQTAGDAISMANNGNQIVWVDGFVGWVYQPGGIAQPVQVAAASGAGTIVLAITGVINDGDPLVIPLTAGGTFATQADAGGPYGPGTSVTVGLANNLPGAVSVGANVIDSNLPLAQITDPNFFPASTVSYFDGYFCFDRKGTKQFFLSPLFAVGPFDAALVASKEATSDLLLAVFNAHEQLYLFGQKRIEVWYDAGLAPPSFPFQRADGAIIQRGLKAVLSIVAEDNTIFWLGEDGIYYRANGFQPERISNHGTESEWQKYPTLEDCRALVFTLFGHKMLTLTFPSARKTWSLDLSTRRWHERESWTAGSEDSSIGRWRVNCCVQAFNRLLFGDVLTGQVAQLNRDVFTEFGATMRGLLVGPPMGHDRSRITMSRFELFAETGVGLKSAGLTESEQYCAQPVQIADPVEIATSGQLTNTSATFATCLFAEWVDLPDDSAVRGMWFSNQVDDATPGTGGLQIGVFNNNSSSAGYQIVVRAYDASNAIIVAAHYAFTSWASWVWVGISIDTAGQRLQVYIDDTALVATSLVWSSSNRIANTAGRPWHLLASGGP